MSHSRENMGEDPRPAPNLPLAMEKIALLVQRISARQGYEVTPHFSRVYRVESWYDLDKLIAKNFSMKSDPDALIMVHGGINERKVKFAGTVVIHGGINKGEIEAKRVITHDPQIGWGQLDHSGDASGKAHASGEEEQRLLDEAFEAAFPSQYRLARPSQRTETQSTDGLPSGHEAVQAVEDFLKEEKDK